MEQREVCAPQAAADITSETYRLKVSHNFSSALRSNTLHYSMMCVELLCYYAYIITK